MNLKKIIILGVVGLASSAVGIMIPRMMSGGHEPVVVADPAADADHEEKTDADKSHSADKSGHPKKTEAKSKADPHAKPAAKGHGKADDHGKKAADHPKDDGHGKDAHAKDAHGGDAHGKDDAAGAGKGPTAEDGVVPFGKIVINLNESNTTFFFLDVTLLTDPDHGVEVKSAVEMRRSALNTWLTAHLADKTISDIKGKSGVNRLRREILDNFNSVLFKDGHERVQDICFEEYRWE